MDIALQILADLNIEQEDVCAEGRRPGAREARSAAPAGGSRAERGRARGQGRRPGRGQGGRPIAASSGRGRGSGRPAGVRRRITKRDRLFNLQAESLNRSGRARTADHLVVPPSEKRAPVRGKGRWKCWTPEATLRAGFGAEVAGQRDVAQQIEGAGHGQAADARYVVSEVVMNRQIQGLQDVGQLRLEFFIRNIMWDETSFDLTWSKGNAAVTQSVLCSHVQVSYRVSSTDAGTIADHDEFGVRDEHVIRSPQVLPRYNAGSLSGALHRLPGGLQEHVDAPVCATLASCDAHRANLKCLKQLHVLLPANHLLLVSLCTQHRAANVVEALTKAIGNLTGVFCLSKVFNYQHTLSHLRQHLKVRLEDKVRVARQPPLAQRAEWAAAASAAKELVRLCLACEGPQPVDAGKKNPMEELLDFFPGPWTGRGHVHLKVLDLFGGGLSLGVLIKVRLQLVVVLRECLGARLAG